MYLVTGDRPNDAAVGSETSRWVTELRPDPHLYNGQNPPFAVSSDGSRLVCVVPALFEAAVTEALIGIGGAAAVTSLVDRLAETPAPVTFGELAKLGPGARAAGPPLLAYLENEDWDLRLWAARTLGYVGYAEAAPTLIELLVLREDWRLNKVAAESLGRLQADEARTALEELSRSHWYPPVREAAVTALKAIDGRADEGSRSDSNYVAHGFFDSWSSGSHLEPCDVAGESANGSRLAKDVALKLQYTLRLDSVDEDGMRAREVARVPHVGMRVGDGWLVGSDRGEWGGELVHLATSAEPQVVLTDNIKGIFETAAGVVALTGLAHMTLNDAWVYRLSTGGDGTWSATKWLALPGAPESAELQSNGVLLIHSLGGSVLLYPDGELEMADCYR